MNGFKVTRLADTQLVSYGPQSDLRVLIGDESKSTPIRAALQTCQPGYDVPFHSHPYIEYLMVLDGSATFTIELDGEQKVELQKGDTVELHPASGTPSRPRHGSHAPARDPFVAGADRPLQAGRQDRRPRLSRQRGSRSLRIGVRRLTPARFGGSRAAGRTSRDDEAMVKLAVVGFGAMGQDWPGSCRPTLDCS
jgi:mannose-6-phosphate isomerase-like protein (cupin superfamily)